MTLDETTMRWLVYALLAALGGLILGYFTGDSLAKDDSSSNLPMIGGGVGFALGMGAAGLGYYYTQKDDDDGSAGNDSYAHDDVYKLY